MHPTLENPHLITCQQIINALNQCHKDSGWKKYIGACNDLKHQLNACLTEDYVARRIANAATAKERRAKAENIWKDLELD